MCAEGDVADVGFSSKGGSKCGTCIGNRAIGGRNGALSYGRRSRSGSVKRGVAHDVGIGDRQFHHEAEPERCRHPTTGRCLHEHRRQRRDEFADLA